MHTEMNIILMMAAENSQGNQRKESYRFTLTVHVPVMLKVNRSPKRIHV